MKKKGFTLIEIIVAIALISVIGVSSVVTINITKEKNEQKRMEKFYSQFDEALEVYLSTHQEIYTNLQDNVEGAVITLDVLKNEGLVKDNIIDPETNQVIDYANKYYILSDAVLLEDKVPEKDVQNACDGRVEISVINSWGTLKDKVNTSDVIYVCPKEAKTEEDNNIDELLQRIESLEQGLATINLGNNKWVLFDVDTDKTKKIYWPEENQDLWLVINNNNTKKEVKLLYNINVEALNNNFEIKYTTPSSPCVSLYDYKTETYIEKDDIDKIKYLDTTVHSIKDSSASGIIELNGILYSISKKTIGKFSQKKTNCFIEEELAKTQIDYFTNDETECLTKFVTGWSKKEIYSDKYNTDNSKKKALYDTIKYKDFVVEKDYYHDYNIKGLDNVGLENIYFNKKIKDKFGTVTLEDDLNSIKSSLIGRSFYSGVFSFINDSFSVKNGYMKINNGSISYSSVNDDAEEKYQVKEDDYIIEQNKFTVGGKRIAEVKTVGYSPVITIKYSRILTKLSEYPNNYRNKYPYCLQDNLLGTKECPYVIKLDDNILSWGN